MAPLMILLTVFSVLWLFNKLAIRDRLSVSTMGRIALSLMLVFTGTSHFFKTAEMIQMIPDFFPNKTLMVYLTGVLEIGAAVGLVIPRFAKWTSIALIFFFLAILPANIVGSFKRVELGGMENGPHYLYFRIPLQMFFIVWTYYFGIYLLNKPLTKVISTQR